ncbi:MAG: hypothetical protein AB7U73_16095 [Pirellulales bacterium]
MNRSPLLVVVLLLIVAFALGARLAPQRGPLVIDLRQPGDALSITLNGQAVGGLRVDAQGRLGIYGPNYTSTAVTLDGQDKLQIDPQPAAAPAARLTVADDAWLTGVLRVGRADAFGDAPLDPNGAIQLGRNLAQAQPMALARFFSQGQESFRLGTTADGCGFISDGAHDLPLLTFRPSGEGSYPGGRIEFYETSLSYDEGTVRGEHPATERTSEIVPR